MKRITFVNGQRDSITSACREPTGILYRPESLGMGFFTSEFSSKDRVREMEQRALGYLSINKLPLYLTSGACSLDALKCGQARHTLQGIWSYETAIEIHTLSDVTPREAPYNSVSKSFRKSTKIPKNLCLHFVNEMRNL